MLTFNPQGSQLALLELRQTNTTLIYNRAKQRYFQFNVTIFRNTTTLDDDFTKKSLRIRINIVIWTLGCGPDKVLNEKEGLQICTRVKKECCAGTNGPHVVI